MKAPAAPSFLGILSVLLVDSLHLPFIHRHSNMFNFFCQVLLDFRSITFLGSPRSKCPAHTHHHSVKSSPARMSPSYHHHLRFTSLSVLPREWKAESQIGPMILATPIHQHIFHIMGLLQRLLNQPTEGIHTHLTITT